MSSFSAANCSPHRKSAVNAPDLIASRHADPFVAAVAEDLVLPDRDGPLQLVDECPGGVEGLTSMRAGRRDHYREVADREVADPVYGGECHRGEAGGHRVAQLAHLLLRVGMCGVAELVDS